MELLLDDVKQDSFIYEKINLNTLFKKQQYEKYK